MKALLKASFSLVFAVVALFSVIAIFVANSTSKLMVAEAERTVRSVVNATTGRIDQLMLGVETAVANSAWIVGEHLKDPDYMYRITRELVENNTYIVGSTVAFRPNYFKERGFYFAPYTCMEKGGELKSFQLGTDENRYHEQEWYALPMQTGGPIWSEPYFDEGGAKIWMSTYSYPLKDADGGIYAIFTADLSLEQLKAHVASICPFPNSYAVMRSAKGSVLVAPPHRETTAKDTITISDKAGNGWLVEITCPIENILAGAQRMVVRIIIFSLLGLGLIFLLSWFYSARLQRATASRERMESELNTARTIQRDLLPRNFPDSIAGVIRPAREVGGDLYDFCECGDKLYFIIGDASGKGVPAALFSFMAVTVFRMACLMGLPPAEIIGRINAALVKGNDMCMFVTVFVGRLDRRSGCLEYGCAGHNPPVIIAPDGSARFLPVKRNTPTGAVPGRSYDEQSAEIERGAKILVYTDGVTEAERADSVQFGDDRLMRFAGGCANASVQDVAKGLLRAVDDFVAGNEQSDDITIMALKS